MSSPEYCLEQAQEAERLAALVSYERDRARLLRQAAEWRARAEALRASDAPPAGRDDRPPRPAPRWLAAVRALLTPRDRRGG